MAKDSFFTPIAPVRWCNLIKARPQLDPEKPHAFTTHLILKPELDEHADFLNNLEKLFNDIHGTKKRSDKGTPWKRDKTDSSLVVVKFKTLQFVDDDGNKSKGPVIIDAKRKPWNGAAIGNGSECIIKFQIGEWTKADGCGITLWPKAVQVLSYISREEEDASEGFEDQEGYELPPNYEAGYVDEFGETKGTEEASW
jgi:hypothetical protein